MKLIEFRGGGPLDGDHAQVRDTVLEYYKTRDGRSQYVYMSEQIHRGNSKHGTVVELFRYIGVTVEKTMEKGK